MLGDSLTQGYGLPEGDGLVPQLERWLLANGEDVALLNAGVSGDTTAGGLARIDWTLSEDVDALIIALGANDMLRAIDPAVSRANLETILIKVKERRMPVLLVGFKAPGNYGPDYKATFDAIYPDLAAQYETLYFDGFFAPLTEGRNNTEILRDLVQPDAIHPNAKGVGIIVSALGPTVVELIRQAEE